MRARDMISRAMAMRLACLLVSLTLATVTHAGDVVGGLVSCMNNEDCVGANRRCLHNKEESSTQGVCTCREGYKPVLGPNSVGCIKRTFNGHFCDEDADCSQGDTCMIVKSPQFNSRSSSRDGGSSSGEEMTRIQTHHHPGAGICISTWLIYPDDEPRTGGGLRSSKFYPDDFFFRRPRVHQQYIGFVEDMMLILFLICILVTLVTVHRASCYRQFQDARRNSPLRHILPIAEDQPPPYISRQSDSADGLGEVIVEDEDGGSEANRPKRQSETPPPTYEEALYRNTVVLPDEREHLSATFSNAPSSLQEDASLPSYQETRLAYRDQEKLTSFISAAEPGPIPIHSEASIAGESVSANHQTAESPSVAGAIGGDETDAADLSRQNSVVGDGWTCRRQEWALQNSGSLPLDIGQIMVDFDCMMMLQNQHRSRESEPVTTIDMPDAEDDNEVAVGRDNDVADECVIVGDSAIPAVETPMPVIEHDAEPQHTKEADIKQLQHPDLETKIYEEEARRCEAELAALSSY